MEYTNNEKFSKPDKNDLYSLALWNENTEKTDAALAIAGKPDEYSAAKTYAVGDKCIYENALYKCITAISTAEAWTAGHWAKTSLCAEDTANKAAIKELTEKVIRSAGASNRPVYFNNGIPTQCGYTVDKSVPSNAVFTDRVPTFLVKKYYYSGKYTFTDHGTVTINFSNKPSGYTFVGILGACAIGAVVQLYVDRISSNSDKAVIWSPNTGNCAVNDVCVEVLYYKNS